MSETINLAGEIRENTGTSHARKMRAAGRVPGNLYGLGRGSVNFSVAEEALRPLVYGSVKVVNIKVGGEPELALFRDVQWDTFSQYVQHFDLQRIDPDKRLTVEIALELKGTSPGAMSGGILDQSQRTVRVECLAHQIPEHIFVRISDLQIGDSLHVSDIEVPEGATILDDPGTLIVRVNAPQETEEEQEELESVVEPELVGRQTEGEAGE